LPVSPSVYPSVFLFHYTELSFCIQVRREITFRHNVSPQLIPCPSMHPERMVGAESCASCRFRPRRSLFVSVFVKELKQNTQTGLRSY